MQIINPPSSHRARLCITGLNETAPSQPPITSAVNSGSLGGNATYEGSQGFFRGFPGTLTNDTAVHFDGSSQDVLYGAKRVVVSEHFHDRNMGESGCYGGKLRSFVRHIQQSEIRLAHLPNGSDWI